MSRLRTRPQISDAIGAAKEMVEMRERTEQALESAGRAAR